MALESMTVIAIHFTAGCDASAVPEIPAPSTCAEYVASGAGCELVNTESWFGCTGHSDCSPGCVCAGELFYSSCVPKCQTNADCPACAFCRPAVDIIIFSPAYCKYGCRDDTSCDAGTFCVDGACISRFNEDGGRSDSATSPEAGERDAAAIIDARIPEASVSSGDWDN